MRCDPSPRFRRAVEALALALVALPWMSCLEAGSVLCPSGILCPEGQTCAANQAACLETPCGNGVLDPGEVCDDGNIEDGDGCSRDCMSDESCGNRIVDERIGEVCDDGNNLNHDGCSADCLSSEGCGNGVPDPGEECDDHNNDNDDDCVEINNQCRMARCGDGVVNTRGHNVEQCDTGGESAICNANCTFSHCGDGFVNASAGEECDMRGNSPTCDADCTLARCGDGFVNSRAGEQCDTGGNSSTCDADCTVPQCGDGFVNTSAGEECDTRGNSQTCNSNCKLARCGDGFLNPLAGEECDDRNSNNEDNCLSICKLNRCGDGAIDRQGPAVEVCDDGNTVTETSCDYAQDKQQCTRCSEDCQKVLHLTGPYCGDGTTNGPEKCDDGNQETESNCPYGTPSCTRCDATCGRVLSLKGQFCGDGTINGSGDDAEACDDGNSDSCGTCDSTCKVEKRAAAHGSITVKAASSIVDGDHFTLRDGPDRSPVTFEFNHNDLTNSNVLIRLVDGETTSAVASRIAVAINSKGDDLRIVAHTTASTQDPPVIIVTLDHESIGEFGNQTIDTNIPGSYLLITGMEGGLGANCDQGMGCTKDEDCKPNSVCSPTTHKCASP